MYVSELVKGTDCDNENEASPGDSLNADKIDLAVNLTDESPKHPYPSDNKNRPGNSVEPRNCSTVSFNSITDNSQLISLKNADPINNLPTEIMSRSVADESELDLALRSPLVDNSLTDS